MSFIKNKMNFPCLKFVFLIMYVAATIVKAQPTQKTAPDRNLLIANLDETFLKLELKWSYQTTKIVKLESVGEMDEDCFYLGSFIEDPER